MVSSTHHQAPGPPSLIFLTCKRFLVPNPWDCLHSKGSFPADIPGHSFLSSADQPDPELLAALESDGKCDSSAGPSAAVTWLAGGGRGRREKLQTTHSATHSLTVPTQTHFR